MKSHEYQEDLVTKKYVSSEESYLLSRDCGEWSISTNARLFLYPQFEEQYQRLLVTNILINDITFI